MRPVRKIDWPQLNGANKSYKPHTTAKPDLENNLGHYCSYCEVFSTDLQVEHVICQDQDELLQHDWNNFLLACARCNGRANKSNKHLTLKDVHFPHLNNTLLSFEYKEGGIVVVNPVLVGRSAARALAMLDLVGLDKYPGNPKYPNFKENDSRLKMRRKAWDKATEKLSEFEEGKLTPEQIADYVSQRGFFSVWFTVFSSKPEVREALFNEFSHTDLSSFDAQYLPIPRNITDLTDPI